MFDSFKKKPDSPEKCQQNQDWVGLSKAYYHLGVAAMEEGDLNHAQLWLARADTIYSADDDVYDGVGDKIIDDCSERIGQLEEEELFYNDVPAQIEEMAESLPDARVRIWGLLSLARFVKLGEQLATLPGCEVLGKIGWAVDTVLKTFQEPPTEAEFNGLRDMASELYELGDSPDFWGMGSEINVPNGAPFEVFDLNGLMGAHLEIDAYLHAHLDMMCALSQDEDPPAPETGIIAQALIPDYYVRTGADNLTEVPQIQAELGRIQDDYDFICSDINWELVQQRIEEYKNLDILA